ncbi:hypothetical protein J2Z23_004186 [Lederbergia galactosidilyticus]|nr:hypothetical protein [Lederbergia galactosidilytica]
MMQKFGNFYDDYICKPIMGPFEKYIWNPMLKHQKITYSCLALIVILPVIIRYLTK